MNANQDLGRFPMIVLGIETSCDETAAGIVSDGAQLHSNVISSQAALHARYGGVVPELASRRHLATIVPVVQAALADAEMEWRHIDAVAVTHGPGLAGSLIVGVNAAKGIAASLDRPLVGVNHLEGHVCAAWLVEGRPPPDQEPGYPLLCLIVSGGHTDLALMEDDGRFQLIGETRDDAAGEAFDKSARVLGLGYPGGPEIERAAEGASSCAPLPRPWMHGTLDFSFSGLKTALVRRAEAAGIYPAPEGGADREAVAALARELQEAIVDVLVFKAVTAAERFGCNGIILGGGVAANARLRKRLLQESPVPVVIPPPILCTDNGAMIAAAAHHRLQRGERSGLDLDVDPGLRLGQGSPGEDAEARRPAKRK